MNTLGIDIGGTAVKVALVGSGQPIATGTSAPYSFPDRNELADALRDAVFQVAQGEGDIESIGMCVPGIVDAESGVIGKAVNLPCVVGMKPTAIVREAIRAADCSIWRFTDAHAAAHDVWDGQNTRMAAVSIGTGVGLCVLDGSVPLDIGSGTPGHLGQIDVSIGRDAPIGPDGGRGGLEAYIGWPALKTRYGDDLRDIAGVFATDDVPLVALARGLRIVHAIYRPQRIVLLGGVGIALNPCIAHLRELVSDQLTSIARENWSLEAGHSLHHAAAGAAKLAAIWAQNSH